MKKSDFYFELPPELIAQTPVAERDHSRLMVLNRTDGSVEHKFFYDLPEYFQPGDCLVLNDSRVIPARLLGARSGGGAAEILLLKELEDSKWECLVRPGKKIRPGTKLTFGNGELSAEVLEATDGGNRIVRFDYEGIFLEVLEALGKMPLPPYITKELEEPERYQTVYSRVVGSAAAPTAGLHFTDSLLDAIREKGVEVCFLTLHVGLGTFRPVKEDEIEDHLMHSEYCTVPVNTAEIVNKAKKNGNKIIAVGTTSCRTLESFSDDDGVLHSGSKWTDIFIYPGYRFKCVDSLVTNFHLPESTLIMLVSALAGRENVLHAYQVAINEKYRFFSFGDAMLIK